MSSDQPALTSSDEVPKMEDDLDLDMKEEVAMSPRPLSPALEPWLPASQPTDERKTWAERIGWVHRSTGIAYVVSPVL